MQIQGGIDLTEKLKFSEIVVRAFELIIKQESLYDIILMQQLGFNPSSWKIWRPAIAQFFSFNKFTRKDNEKGIIKIKIEYRKKEKLWKLIDLE